MNYEELQTHIKFIMDFMKENYPTNFEMILNSEFATIRSTLQAITFINKPTEENKEDIPNVDEITEKVE